MNVSRVSARVALATALSAPLLLLGTPAYAADVTYSTPTGFSALTVSRDAGQTVTILNNSLTQVAFTGVGTAETVQVVPVNATVTFTMRQASGSITAGGTGVEFEIVIL